MDAGYDVGSCTPVAASRLLLCLCTGAMSSEEELTSGGVWGRADEGIGVDTAALAG